MKKYAVFTNTEFVPTHELSVSNKIIEREDVLTVMGIVKTWAESIYPGVIVTYRGDKPTISGITTIFKGIAMKVIHKEHNVRFQLGKFEPRYKTKEVNY